jgi:hypothetical protein
MGKLMLRCPTTGPGFATGVNTDEATFGRLPDADRSIGGDHATHGYWTPAIFPRQSPRK